jgi:hypothetical protein
MTLLIFQLQATAASMSLSTLREYNTGQVEVLKERMKIMPLQMRAFSRGLRSLYNENAVTGGYGTLDFRRCGVAAEVLILAARLYDFSIKGQ